MALELVTTQVCKAMCHTFLEGVWLSDIGRMADVRNVPHLAVQGVSTGELGHFNGEKCTAPCSARCEYRRSIHPL